MDVSKKCSALREAEWAGPNINVAPLCLTCPGRQWLGPFSVHGSGEQIFGADEQVPKGGCGPCPKNTLWTRELRKSFKRNVRPYVCRAGRAELLMSLRSA